MNKTHNQKAWFFVIPVFVLVAFNAVVPLMTVLIIHFKKLLEAMFLHGKEQDGSKKFYILKDFTHL